VNADHTAIFTLAGALGGAAVVGVLGLLGQRAQIRSGDRRLEKQLNHARDQRDLEILTVLLGDGAEALGAVRKSFMRLIRLWANEVPSSDPRREDAAADQRAASGAARSVLDRLGLHLAADDPIFREYKGAMLTLDEIGDLLYGAGTEPYEFHRTKIEDLGSNLERQITGFADLARARVGPQSQAEPPG
jgi:hypothetical protein